ncbi:unnamed protein product, partial [Allacma fusca]
VCNISVLLIKAKIQIDLFILITDSRKLNSRSDEFMEQLQLNRHLITVDEDYVLALYSRSVDINPNDQKIFRKKSHKRFIAAKQTAMCLREEKLPEKKFGTFGEIQQFESIFKRSALRRYNYNQATLSMLNNGKDMADLPAFPIIQKILVTEIGADLNGTVTYESATNIVGGGILAIRIVSINSDGINGHLKQAFYIFTWLLALASIAAVPVVIKGTGNLINGQTSLTNRYGAWSFIYPNGNILYTTSISLFTNGMVEYFRNNHKFQEDIFVEKYVSKIFNDASGDVTESLNSVKVAFMVIQALAVTLMCGKAFIKFGISQTLDAVPVMALSLVAWVAMNISVIDFVWRKTSYTLDMLNLLSDIYRKCTQFKLNGRTVEWVNG